AVWYEREAWDMLGLLFIGHPDMRRILTDYGFKGYPLRKDFPLTGFEEVGYSEKQRLLVYEPVVLAQDYRLYLFSGPWYPTGSRTGK
ncbi:MAG: NADH-quinone oxidoreductase subunit C, partial [Chloroflexi bacterium]